MYTQLSTAAAESAPCAIRNQTGNMTERARVNSLLLLLLLQLRIVLQDPASYMVPI